MSFDLQPSRPCAQGWHLNMEALEGSWFGVLDWSMLKERSAAVTALSVLADQLFLLYDRRKEVGDLEQLRKYCTC